MKKIALTLVVCLSLSPVLSGFAATHNIKKGDTLYSIARMYGTTVADIQKSNGLKNSLIIAGKKLVIPVKGNVAPVPGANYTVKKGDTLYSLAKKHGTTVVAIQKANNLKNTLIKAGQKLVIPGKTIVKPSPVLPPAVISTPGKLHIDMQKGTTVSLSWTAASGKSDGYNVYVNGVKNNASVLKTNEYTVKGLSYSSTYTFAVTNVVSGVESLKSSISYQMIAPIVQPSLPASPVHLDVTNGDLQSLVTWTAKDLSATGYNVYVDGIKANTTLIQNTEYLLSNLLNGHVYQVTVTAVNAIGLESKFSDYVFAEPHIPFVSPPSGINDVWGDQQVGLDWESVEGAVGYNVYVDGQKHNSSLITSTFYFVNGLNNQDPYNVTIRTVFPNDRESGDSYPSWGVPLITPNTPVVISPANNSNGTAGLDLAVSILNNDELDVVRYVVVVGPDQFETSNINYFGTNTVIIPGYALHAGSTQEVVVYAENSNGTRSAPFVVNVVL